MPASREWGNIFFESVISSGSFFMKDKQGHLIQVIRIKIVLQT